MGSPLDNKPAGFWRAESSLAQMSAVQAGNGASGLWARDSHPARIMSLDYPCRSSLLWIVHGSKAPPSRGSPPDPAQKREQSMMRRFLNLVVESLDTGLYSLRRMDLSGNLFYPSATAAEAAIKANAEKQAIYKHRLPSLQTVASRLELPGALINLKPSGPYRMSEPPLDLISLLGDESRIFWSDSAGFTSLYDADSHSVMTVPNLGAPKGQGAIPISITRPRRDALHGSPVEQCHSLYVMGRTLPHGYRDYCFEELSCEGGQDVLSTHDLLLGWCALPPPPIWELPDQIDAYTVVGRTIYVSSTTPGIGTYAFDTQTAEWSFAGKWCLPFSGKAEYVPELKLWIGLSATRPFHLCASDLSVVDFKRPPTVHQTWVDLEMPKGWYPFQKDLINLGSGRFCVVKMFMPPRYEMGFSDDEDNEKAEALDFWDVYLMDFAVLTGIELVVASQGKLRMLKHMSKYHTFEDDVIRWVL